MSQTRRYHTVIFDVGGTLVGYEDDAPFDEFLATIDVPHRFVSGSDLRLSMLHTLSLRRHESVGLGLDDDSINTWWLTIFTDLFPRSPETARRMWTLFKQNYFDSLFPDTVPILALLAERNVPLGIISNYGTNLLELLPKLGIHDYFNFIIVSAVVGVTKPSPRIFETAIEKAGVAADQILYIGDNPLDDIEGATAVGIDAVLVNRPGREPNVAPVMIDDLMELVPLIFPDAS